MSRAAAVVVTWNSAGDVAACLDAALAQTVPLDVVVVDNASTDGTREILASYDARARVVPLQRNTGYAVGNLRGLAEVEGSRPAPDYLLLLNPDAVMAPDTVERLIRHLETAPRCAAAAALLVEPDGAPQHFLRPEPTLRRAFWWFLALPERHDRTHGRRRKAAREQHALLAHPPSAPFDVEVPAAACVLLRRAALPDPVLDPAFPLFFNDVDLYRRLRDAGWSVTVVPAARVAHGHGRSHRQLPRAEKRAEQLRSLRTYARTWWPRPLALFLDLLLLLDAAACVATRRPELRAAARGTLGGLGLPFGARPWLSARRPARARPPRPAPTPPS